MQLPQFKCISFANNQPCYAVS